MAVRALTLGLALGLAAAPGVRAGPHGASARADPVALDYRLAARELAPGVYVVEGANADFSRANGCNIINTGFIVGRDGVLVVNTGPSRRYGEQLRALIARITPLPVALVVHLNLHPDYFLGNQAFADVPRAATDLTRAGMRARPRPTRTTSTASAATGCGAPRRCCPTARSPPGRWRWPAAGSSCAS